MPKVEWGTKRLCPTTGKRFYDLNRTPVVSPYTGDTVNLNTGSKSHVAIAEKPKEEAEEDLKLTDDADEVIEESGDADVDIEDDLLEDDDNDNDNVSLDEIADVATEEDDT